MVWPHPGRECDSDKRAGSEQAFVLIVPDLPVGYLVIILEVEVGERGRRLTETSDKARTWAGA